MSEEMQENGCEHRFEYACEKIEYPPTSTTSNYQIRRAIAVCVKCGEIRETMLQ